MLNLQVFIFVIFITNLVTSEFDETSKSLLSIECKNSLIALERASRNVELNECINRIVEKYKLCTFIEKKIRKLPKSKCTRLIHKDELKLLSVLDNSKLSDNSKMNGISFTFPRNTTCVDLKSAKIKSKSIIPKLLSEENEDQSERKLLSDKNEDQPKRKPLSDKNEDQPKRKHSESVPTNSKKQRTTLEEHSESTPNSKPKEILENKSVPNVVPSDSESTPKLSTSKLKKEIPKDESVPRSTSVRQNSRSADLIELDQDESDKEDQTEGSDVEELSSDDAGFGKDIQQNECTKNISTFLLEEEDLISLKDKSWLTNYVIDYSILYLIGADEFQANSKYVYLLATIGSFLIFGNSFTEQSMINKMKFKDKIILFPINLNNLHWCLMLADMEKKTIQFYDPMNVPKRNAKKGRRILKNFLRFMSKRNNFVDESEKIDVNYKNWKAVAPEIQISRQKDVYNCGVFVIMYIDCFIHKHKCRVNPDRYRKYLLEAVVDQII